MKNERNAGRKPKITESQMCTIIKRYKNGESLANLAEEYGVSRQALYKRMHSQEKRMTHIDWVVDGECVTALDVDFNRQDIHITYYAVEISKRLFGFNTNPTWQDFIRAMEDAYLKQRGLDAPGLFLVSDGDKRFSLDEIHQIHINEDAPIAEFRFTKKDILLTRTDTDGFQMKALTADRRFFVKSQAVMSGTVMRDWAVEIIAADIANQLGIPCVRQQHCRFIYGEKKMDGVFSDNFELDGDTFISFESLLESQHLSSRDDSFVHLGTLEKLKWCAKALSRIGDLPYAETERYMMNLAVLDCLVGNVDRHTHNFGLFYNLNSGEYRIPMIFDNGMGLFEHDYYRDQYSSFDAAMNQVYVAPYGEDPFEMLVMLNEEFHLKKCYPGVEKIVYGDILNTAYAVEYERRMNELWQKLD